MPPDNISQLYINIPVLSFTMSKSRHFQSNTMIMVKKATVQSEVRVCLQVGV